MYQLRKDIWINFNQVSLVIDQGYAGAKHNVRTYTPDGRHEYSLTNEEYTKLMMKLEEMKE